MEGSQNLNKNVFDSEKAVLSNSHSYWLPVKYFGISQTFSSYTPNDLLGLGFLGQRYSNTRYLTKHSFSCINYVHDILSLHISNLRPSFESLCLTGEQRVTCLVAITDSDLRGRQHSGSHINTFSHKKYDQSWKTHHVVKMYAPAGRIRSSKFIISKTVN